MKKLLSLLKVIQHLIILPFSISKGSKKREYRKIKHLMIRANLL